MLNTLLPSCKEQDWEKKKKVNASVPDAVSMKEAATQKNLALANVRHSVNNVFHGQHKCTPEPGESIKLQMKQTMPAKRQKNL